MRSFKENLALYAKLVIHGGVAVQPGQELLLSADIQAAEFARLVVAEAYTAGAKNVHISYSDEEATLIRYQKAGDPAFDYVPQWVYDGFAAACEAGAARLTLSSANPGLLKDVDSNRVARTSKAAGHAGRQLASYVAEFKINWSIVGVASPAWAKLVFPHDDEATAMEKLWNAIFLVSRVLEEDPLKAWKNHCDSLEVRKQWLNEKALTEVHFKGPGTDLRIGLADKAIWEGGWGQARNAVFCGPNMPTEEVFTMPHRARVDGYASSTKPLSVRGQVVDGIRVEFMNGIVTKAEAKQGEDTFAKLLETDEGSKHLGEVALVPHSCKVSEAGILFYNTLYDENAASHIAMGRCYSENMEGYDGYSGEERLAMGANDSLIHVDWMIGSGEVDVDGKTPSGDTVSLMRAGEWIEKL